MAENRERGTKQGSTGVNPALRWLREVRGEVRKVTWPTQREAWRLTGIVLAATFVLGMFLWVFDFIFSTGVSSLVDLIILSQ